MFPPVVINAFKLHAMTEFPREACGIVVELPDGGFVYLECDNIAPEPEKDATIAGKDIARAHNMGTIRSFLHSHTHGKVDPSGADMKAQLQWNLPFGISTATADSCSNPFYFGTGAPVAPYTGRLFINGWQDCYALVKDWYRQELGIELPVIPHDNWWWKANKNLYVDNFAKVGFRQLKEDEPLQRGDGFLMKVRSPVPNHAGIYIGNGTILHHLESQYSVEEPLHRWRNHLWGWFRHEGANNA